MNKSKLGHLELQCLATFVSLVDHHSATIAAKELNIPIDKVSRQINQCRKAIGDPLFTRKQHGLEPNACAVSIAPMAREILYQAKKIEEVSRKLLGAPPLLERYHIVTPNLLHLALGCAWTKCQPDYTDYISLACSAWSKDSMAQLVSGDARFGLYLDYAPITLDQSCKGLQTIELKQLPNLYLLAHEQHPIWKSGNLSTELHRYPNLGEQLALGNTCTQPCLERLATLESNLQDAQHLCLVPIVTLNLVCELMPSLNAETLSVRHTMNYYRHRAVPKLFAIGQPEQLKRLQSPLIDTINYMI